MGVLTLGYRSLSKADPRFSLPSTLMLVLMAGVFVVAAGVIPLFNSIPNMLASAPASPDITPSSDFVAAAGSLVIDLLLLGLGGLLALVGFIGGLVLGLWRVGSRYGETIVKVGAILLIVPLLNIVAPILIIVGAYQARDRLNGGAAPPPSDRRRAGL